MKDIRALFLEYFANKGHKVYDAMPLVPDDASLLFTNAGMVQFKDIFTGKIPRPTPPRATSSQLCIRAGGKHNDLENVGYTARHHTLFEMLGNFSFGDYFKREAIAYAWEFVTNVLAFDKSVIYVSVHESDDEAFHIWSEFIDTSRIKRMGDKDNFWQMGDTGPCGPCSEIYIDQGEAHFNSSEDYFGGEGDRFLEIWNLVFMQYERDSSGKLTPLPKPSIDTGMGLERVYALKEGRINNYDTSLFAPLMRKIEELTGEKYVRDDEISSNATKQARNLQASFRVIADHARSVAFLLAQGVNFDKEGRGYVLRRILRRAVRHGYLLGLKKPFLCEVVGVVCESMGGHYGYLLERKGVIMEQCEMEEARFFETIEAGMELFREAHANMLKTDNKLKKGNTIYFSGEIAFKLYDTFGFPLDLTQDMLKEYNTNEVKFEVDLDTFQACMQDQKSRSKASWRGSGKGEANNANFNALLSAFGENAFVGYTQNSADSSILALLDSNFAQVNALKAGAEGYVLLDSTPFYPESGGPIGDIGTLEAQNATIANVLDTKKYFGLNMSKISTLRDIKTNDNILARVDSTTRREIAKHHSATHLLHLALRQILGSHIAQAGSLVESTRLRFDFSHPKALSSEEISKIQDFVNARIWEGNAQKCEIMPINEAKARGACALFGEKYGERVRVISFGESMELCGGIHVANSAEIGSFYITKESGVSSGVRRIEAVCGKAGYEYGKSALKVLSEAKIALKNNDILQAITKLKAKGKSAEAHTISTKSLESSDISGVKVIIQKIEGTNGLKDMVDRAKNESERVAIMLFGIESGKISIVAGVKNAPISANAWIKDVAKIVGGNGGGREDFATAGGKDIEALESALDSARAFVTKALS